MRQIVLGRVSLLQQDFGFFSCPPPGPRFVRPAEAERKVRVTRRQHFTERAIEKPPTVEPIVPIAEPFDPVRTRERGLLLARLRKAKVVEPEVCRQVGLVMSAKERLSHGDVAPLGKSGPPPLVVFWDWVELWQVIRNYSGGSVHRGLQMVSAAFIRRHTPATHGPDLGISLIRARTSGPSCVTTNRAVT